MTISKRKKVWASLGIVFLCSVLLVSSTFLPSSNPYYNNNKKWWQGFGFFTYETLRHKSTEQEKEAAQPILVKIEEALSYIGSEEDCTVEEAYHPLCIFTSLYPGVKSAEHYVNFVTLKKTFYRANLWFEYSFRGYDENAETYRGSGPSLALAKLKLVQGNWVAEKIITLP